MKFFSNFSYFILLLPIAIGAGANAVEKQKKFEEPEMRVTLVQSRDDEGKPGGVEWISLEGRFVKSAVGRLRDVLKTIRDRKPPVLINSGGGDVDASLAMGRMIRAKGLSVAVARTQFYPAPPGEDGKTPSTDAKSSVPRGRPISYGAYCASACAFVLAAGKERYTPAGVRVGLHQMIIPEHDAVQRVRYLQTRYLKRDDRIVWKETRVVGERKFTLHVDRQNATPAQYRKVAAYFDEMGLPSKAILELMKRAPADRIYWLFRSELAATELITNLESAEQYLGYAPMPAPSPPVSAAAAAYAASWAQPLAGVKPAVVPTASTPQSAPATAQQPSAPLAETKSQKPIQIDASPSSAPSAQKEPLSQMQSQPDESSASPSLLGIGAGPLVAFFLAAMGTAFVRSQKRTAAASKRSEPPTA